MDEAAARATRVRTALHFREQGRAIIALNGKRPMVKDWTALRAEQQTLAEVADCARRGNVGLPTGHGLVVIDIDAKPEEHERILRELGLEGVVTPTCLTGSGGLHLYFKVQSGKS